jgi:hypothetical protein
LIKGIAILRRERDAIVGAAPDPYRYPYGLL